MKKRTATKEEIDALNTYLDFCNNYLTYEKIAEDYGITEQGIAVLIDYGRTLHPFFVAGILGTQQPETDQSLNVCNLCNEQIADGSEILTLIDDKSCLVCVFCNEN